MVLVHSLYELPKAFFIKIKSEEHHSNNKINDNIGDREAQMKVKNILTMKIEKGGNKTKTYDKTQLFLIFFGFAFILFPFTFPVWWLLSNK